MTRRYTCKYLCDVLYTHSGIDREILYPHCFLILLYNMPTVRFKKIRRGWK
jgi:hypothetical protein